MAYDGTLKFNTLIDASGFQSGINKIGSIAEKGLKATGAILTGSASVIGGLGLAAVKVGMDFDSAMSKVEAISGAAGDELQQLRDKAIEMGDKTKYSATESAEAFTYMAMAGWKTEAMLDGIEGIMNLAAASGEDLATTSDIVTDALTAFGLKAEDSAHFADVLAAASSNANTNVGMMGETFKYVAPVAGALGFSAEDTATAIGLMASSGIKASQAGTSLRSIMSRLAKPTDEVQAAMDALGISLTGSKGKMKSLNEIVGDLRNGFDGLSKSEKAEMAAALGGQEAMSGLLAIVNASDEDYKKLQDAINGATDEMTGYSAAAEMAETMNDNLSGQLTILKGQLETFGIMLVDDVQEPMKDVVKEAQSMVSALKEAYTEDGLGGLVTAAGEVLADVVAQIAEAAPALVDTAVDLVTAFCDGLKTQDGLAEAGAELITKLATALFECADQIWSTAIVLAGKLAGGIAAGAPDVIQAAIDCVSSIVDTAIKWAPTILNAGISIVGSLIQGLVNGLPDVVSTGIEILNKLTEGIKQTLPNLIPVAMTALMNFSGTLRENVGELVNAGLELIMTLAQSLIDNIPVFIETIPTIVTNIAGIINDNAPKLLMCGIELIGNLAMGLIRALPTLVANIPQIIQAIVSVFTAFNWLNLGASIIKAIKDGAVSLATSLPKALKNIGQTAKDWISLIEWKTLGSDIIDLIQIGIQSLVTAIPAAIKNIGTTAVAWFKDIDWIDLGANLIKGVIAGITGALDGLWSAVSDFCSGLIDNVKSFFGINSPSTVMAEQGNYLVQGLVNGIASMPAELAAYLDQTVQKIIAWGQQMFSNVQNIIQNLVSTAVNLISQLPGEIWTWLVETVNKVIQWGINLKNTADTYVSNTIDSAVKFFSQLPGKLWTWLVNTVTKIKQWGANMLSSASSAASNTISKVSEWFSQLPGKVWKWLSDTISKAVQFGSDMAAKASSAASEFCSKLEKGLSDLPDQMVTIGSNIVSGIWEGISGGWDWLVGKVKGLADSLVKGAKDALGIESPSKVFAQEVGRWIPPGIGVGIDCTMPDLESQVGDEMDRLVRKLQTAVKIETGNITVKSKARAEHQADTEYPTGGDTYVEEKFEQTNNYHVPVATPSETSKAQREAARKLLGGIK